MSLSPQSLERMRELLAEVHSLAGLVTKIEQELSTGIGETDELKQLSAELTKGLDLSHELALSLGRTALALHIELLSRRGSP
jgi:hypothetical protein